MYLAVLKCNKSSASLQCQLLFLFPSWLVLEKFGVWFDTWLSPGNITRCHDNVTPTRVGNLWQRSWWRTRETSLGVPFETCLRRRGDVLMGRLCFVLLRCYHDVPKRCREEHVPLRRLGETLLSVSFETYLRRRWVVQREYVNVACSIIWLWLKGMYFFSFTVFILINFAWW